MSGVRVRRPMNDTARVVVLGTIESRMQTADVVILTGLNDGKCRPKYILLIGDEIPYSTGELNNISNPPTDMYYACVDEYYTENEDITPDIYVGRWPVHNTAELEYIILKSEGYGGTTGERIS